MEKEPEKSTKPQNQKQFWCLLDLLNRNRKSDDGFTASIVVAKMKSEKPFWRTTQPHASWEDLQKHDTNAICLSAMALAATAVVARA
jgi:hypothetical protein